MFNNKFTKKDSVVDAVSQVLESYDDDEDDDVKRADAELRRMKAKPIEADKGTDPDKEIGKLAKKTPKEVDESVEQIEEAPKSALGRSLYRALTPKKVSPDKIARNKARTAELQAMKPKVPTTEETVTEDKWTDIADGPWKKTKKTPSQAASAAANAAGKGLKGAQHKLDVAEPKGKLTAADFKKLRKEDAELQEGLDSYGFHKTVEKPTFQYSGHGQKGRLYLHDTSRKSGSGTGHMLATFSKEKHANAAAKKHNGKVEKTGLGSYRIYKEETDLQEKTLTSAESKKKEEIVKSMKKGLSGFKERYGKRAKEVMYATATKQAKKVAEEIETVDEKVKVKVSTNKPIGYKVSDIGPGKKEYNVKTDKSWDDAQKKKNVSEAQGPTSTYSSDTFAQPENPTSSAITPLQRIKALVQPTKKMLNNTLMGKAGATSEEIDPTVKSTDTLKGRVKGGKSDDVGPGADGKSTKVKYIPGPK